MTIPAGPPDPPPNVLVPVLITTVVLLHLTGSGGLISTEPGWSSSPDTADPVALAFAALRAVTAVSCYYLLAIQAMALVGRVVGRTGMVQWAHHLTPPPLRSTTRRLAGIGVTALTTLASPLPRAAADPVPGHAVMRVIDPPTSTAAVRVVGRTSIGSGERSAIEREPATELGDRSATIDRPPGDAPTGTAMVRVADGDTRQRHLVRPGDHLWAIAETELARQLGAPAGDASIERYWHQLVLANPQLDDPDLVFPGDVIELPPVRHTG